MNLIAIDDKILELLGYENSLLDSVVEKIEISNENDTLQIKVYFKLIRDAAKYKNICLEFYDVLEYSFYHNSDYVFCNVARLKFFKHSSIYYISIDPFDEADEISIEDQDFIKAKSIKCYEVK
jgi:hypothetical protein